MKLIVVRHAESHANKAQLFDNSSSEGGSPLTETGRKQAYMLADYLSELFTVDCIYLSPTIRTLDTATILKEKLKSPFIIIDELKEIDCGKWEGMYVDCVRENYAKEWEKRKEKPIEFCFPQGESLLDVKSRVAPFIDTLLKKSQQQTNVLVSHSAVISVLLAYLHDWHLEESWLDKRSYHGNSAFTVLDIDSSTKRVLFSKVASTIHLENV